MSDPYRQLAARLDALPNGFPPTATGVEIRILQHIFSPDDAAVALALLPVPESAAAIARRLGRPVEETRALLDAMAAKGQIAAVSRRGRPRYALVPFVVGIYEFQLPRIDRTLALLCEEYLPTLMKTLGGFRPALARVVPVGVRIDAAAEVLACESVREIIGSARSIRLMECVCRREQEALGSPCRHRAERCLAIADEPEALRDFPPWGRLIGADEALAVLDATEREGLVHCTFNVRQSPMFICNCCSCCCGFLRGLREFEAPHLLVRSNYVARIAGDDCVSCGECASGRCPMDAIAEREGGWAVDAGRCIGCGVCAVACATGAIALVARPRAERTVPPGNVLSWAYRRAAERSGPVHALAQFARVAARAARPEPR